MRRVGGVEEKVGMSLGMCSRLRNPALNQAVIGSQISYLTIVSMQPVVLLFSGTLTVGRQISRNALVHPYLSLNQQPFSYAHVINPRTYNIPITMSPFNFATT